MSTPAPPPDDEPKGDDGAAHVAVVDLRALLRQLDRAWKALSVLGPDEDLGAALDAAGVKLQRYLTAYDDRPQQRAARRQAAASRDGR